MYTATLWIMDDSKCRTKVRLSVIFAGYVSQFSSSVQSLETIVGPATEQRRVSARRRKSSQSPPRLECSTARALNLFAGLQLASPCVSDVVPPSAAIGFSLIWSCGTRYSVQATNIGIESAIRRSLGVKLRPVCVKRCVRGFWF